MTSCDGVSCQKEKGGMCPPPLPIWPAGPRQPVLPLTQPSAPYPWTAGRSCCPPPSTPPPPTLRSTTTDWQLCPCMTACLVSSLSAAKAVADNSFWEGMGGELWQGQGRGRRGGGQVENSWFWQIGRRKAGSLFCESLREEKKLIFYKITKFVIQLK